MKQVHEAMGMKIGDIMTREVAVVGPKASLSEVAKVMKDRDVGMCPVVDGDQVVGVVTDRNITVRGVAEDLDPASTPIREIMTTEIIFCYDDEDVTEAVESMEEKQIRRVVVLDRSEKLVGVISIGDLALDTGDRNLAGELLKFVSAPEGTV